MGALCTGRSCAWSFKDGTVGRGVGYEVGTFHNALDLHVVSANE